MGNMATTPSPFLKPTSIERAEPAPAKQPKKESPKDAPQKSNGGFRWLLIAAGVLALAVLVAAGIYFAKRHRRSRFASAIAGQKPALSAKPVPRVAIDLPLDAFVVNLADAGGHSYARIGLTLRLTEPVSSQKDAPAENATDDLRDMIRDQIIAILNQEQSQDLLVPDGKQQLKEKIKAAIVGNAHELQVADIYFTQFLVQP